MPSANLINELPARRVPQVTLLLDDDFRILSLSSSLAGSAFAGLRDDPAEPLHDQLHPDCSGDCRFIHLMRTAISRLSTDDCVEWELDDDINDRLLRLTLSKAPVPKRVDGDRRQRHLLLTVADITRQRRELELALNKLNDAAAARRVNEYGSSESLAVNDCANGAYVSDCQRLVFAREGERQRIAAELHDSVVQAIGIAKFRLEGTISRHKGEIPSDLYDVVDELRNVMDEVRRISSDLSPTSLSDFGLVVALDKLVDGFARAHPNADVELDCDIDETALSQALSITIFRVTQEALQNVSKHANADRIEISLGARDNQVRLSVADDGNGFEPRSKNSSEASGLGIRSMQERVVACGGTFELSSAPGKGTRVVATWPHL